MVNFVLLKKFCFIGVGTFSNNNGCFCSAFQSSLLINSDWFGFSEGSIISVFINLVKICLFSI